MLMCGFYLCHRRLITVLLFLKDPIATSIGVARGDGAISLGGSLIEVFKG